VKLTYADTNQNSFRGINYLDKSIDFDIVADIYDDYVNTDFDIEFYKEVCKGYVNVLELMCGTGRISIPLVRMGINLTCVDYSQGMLNMFRKKLLPTDVVNVIYQDVINLDLGQRFDLAFIPFNSIAEIINKDKRKQALQRIFEHLSSNGVFLCTLYNPAYRIKLADGNIKNIGSFAVNDHNTLVVSYYNNYSLEDKTIFGTQYYEVYGQDGKMLEKRALDIRFSVISKDEILDMCGEIGFSLKEIYGDYQFSPFTDTSMFMNCIFNKP